jgi:hypothetical protein
MALTPRVVSVELPDREPRILETPYRNACDAGKGSVEDILTVLGEGARIVLSHTSWCIIE